MASYNILRTAERVIRRGRVTVLFLALAAASALCFCGCSAWIEVWAADENAAGASVPVSAPVQTPEPTPEPTATGNPVAAFFDRFYSYSEASVARLFSRLTSETTIDAMLTLMRLSSHNSELAAALVSAGRLSSGGSVDYYDTLFEAAKGTGGVYAQGDGTYSFTFLYNDGAYMEGTLTQSSISYAVWDADGNTVSGSYIGESGAGWLSFVDKNGERSVMRCKNGEAWFSHFEYEYAYEYEPPQSADAEADIADADIADAETAEAEAEVSPSPSPTPSPSPVPGWYSLVSAEATVYSTLDTLLGEEAGD